MLFFFRREYQLLFFWILYNFYRTFLLFDDFGDFGDFTFGTATVGELSPTTVFFDEVGVDDLDLVLDLT